MLKSKTRLRVAVKTAVVATAGAGIFSAFPALASIYAAPKPVIYNCTVAGGGAGAPYTFTMDITGPASGVVNSPLVATWKISPPATLPSLTPSVSVSPGASLVADAEMQISASPAGVLTLPTELRSILVTAAPPAAGQPVTAPPLVVTVTPLATGVVAFQPDAFTLLLATGAGAANEVELLDCAPPEAAQASPAALRVTVGTGSPSASPSPTTTSPTPTPSNSATRTPTPTVTVTQTRTSDVEPDPDANEQIDETPKGAASTGGGGDAGPDARMIMFSGVLMVALAGFGGLVLRRRTAGRG
ncbi:hypothetical protein [Streptosporangium sp. V21-05]|uniref:hypothetical protein n=1 Tax=Streptosporangium sp. V21-05 TaxID=3446115 RepID=UPI003F52BE7B